MVSVFVYKSGKLDYVEIKYFGCCISFLVVFVLYCFYLFSYLYNLLWLNLVHSRDLYNVVAFGILCFVVELILIFYYNK